MDGANREDGGFRSAAAVSRSNVGLVFPPRQPPLVSAGVLGPRSLVLAGRVAGGTILPEGQGPAEMTAARTRIEHGMSGRGDGATHRLTVFAAFHCGDRSELGTPNPDAPQGLEAMADHPDAVAAKLRTLTDAGADAVVLVPLDVDVVGQLQLARAEITPRLRG